MKKHLVGIIGLVGEDIIIDVDRQPIDAHLLHGFVVGVSEKLLLLHIVDGNTLLLGGYAALPLSHIRSYHMDETFVSRALRLLERKPIIPEGIDLSDWVSLLTSVQSRYALLQIETEKKEPDVCFIGRISRQTAQYIQLEKVNKEGKWDETERFELKDITQVKFDNGYVNALSHLVAYESSVR